MLLPGNAVDVGSSITTLSRFFLIHLDVFPDLTNMTNRETIALAAGQNSIFLNMNTRLSAVVFHLIHCNHAPCFRLSPDHLSLCPACRLLPRTDKSVLEQQKAVAVYSWEAQGQMVFRCTYDERGFSGLFVSARKTA